MAVIELNAKPAPRDLKWFGFILPAFFVIVGAIAWFRFDASRISLGLGLVGLALTTVYWTLPPFRIPVYLGWIHLFFPLGWTISHLALIVLYYLIVTPIGLLLRLFRYDPMHRRWERDRSSYWTPHRTGQDPSRYLRQF